MANNKAERELGSTKGFEIGEDGSISYFTDEVPDDVRAAAESERDRLSKDREQAAVEDQREVGTPDLGVDVFEEDNQ